MQGQRGKSWNTVLGMLCQVILLAGLVSGILFFAGEELAIPFQAHSLWGAVAIFSFLAVALCQLPVASGWLALGGAVCSGMALWGFWTPVSLGARQAADSWIQLFNVYFNQWKASPQMPELTGLSQQQVAAVLGEASQVFLTFLAGLLLFWGAFFLIRLNSLALLHVLMGLELFCILTVGVVPEGYAALWYLAFFLLWWSAGGSWGLSGEGNVPRWRFRPASLPAFFCSSLAMALALLVCAGFLIPRTQGVLADGSGGMKTWIRARLEETADWDAILGDSTRAGGVNGGNLANQGNRAEAGSVALRVTVEELPQEPLYLKAYVGSGYQGDSWEILPEDLLEEETGLSPESVWQFPVDRLRQAGADFQTISVELYDAATQYLYVPYGTELPEETRLVSDQYLRRWASQTDVFSFSMDWGALAGAGVSWQEETYAAYVRCHYLETPEASVWDTWREQRPDGEDLDQMIRQIQAYLAQQATYTLTPGTLPEGEDFVQYFLFENRQGYCTHFASAATLLLRLWDIPARYVEGYVIFPESFQDNGDGTWTAWVTDRSAHAWTEVYQDGLSWQPAEATPPYLTGTVPPSQETPQGEEAEETAETAAPGETEAAESSAPAQEETDGRTEMSEETETPAASDTGLESDTGSPRKENVVVLIMVFAGVAAVGILAVVKRRRQAERRRRMGTRNRRAALLALGEEAERLLAEKQERLSLLEENFGEKAEKRVQGVSRQELEELAELVQRAWFSGHPVTEEEYQRSWALYQKIRDHRNPPLTFWKRFWREIP